MKLSVSSVFETFPPDAAYLTNNNACRSISDDPLPLGRMAIVNEEIFDPPPFPYSVLLFLFLSIFHPPGIFYARKGKILIGQIILIPELWNSKRRVACSCTFLPFFTSSK